MRRRKTVGEEYSGRLPRRMVPFYLTWAPAGSYLSDAIAQDSELGDVQSAIQPGKKLALSCALAPWH